MKIVFVLSLLLLNLASWGQRPQKVQKQLGAAPVFFIDSVEVEPSALQQYQPENIASVSVYKDSTARRLVGPRGQDGVIYTETKPFAVRRYRRFFALKSVAYAQLVAAGTPDSTIQYVLNGRPLMEKYEGDLSLVDNQTFQSLNVLDRTALRQRYPTSNRASYSVLVTSRVPKDLYHGKRKF